MSVGAEYRTRFFFCLLQEFGGTVDSHAARALDEGVINRRRQGFKIGLFSRASRGLRRDPQSVRSTCIAEPIIAGCLPERRA
jgi:hypothetical protein